MKSFFSVIIPTLNEEQYISGILEDLSRQTFRQFEVIIVDGKSEDGTLDRIGQYKSVVPNLTILHSKQRNVSYQRNKGARYSKAAFFVFFDADVRVNSDFLEKIFAHMSTENTLLCTTNLIPDQWDITKYLITSLSNIGRDILLFLKQPYAAGGYNIIISSALFKQLKGFDERLHYSEDMDLLIRAYKKGVLLTNLHQPTQKYNFRRLEKFGYIPIIKTYITTMVQLYFGTHASQIEATYPMDGNRFKNI